MAFDPNRPFNDLPNLPPASETETKAILRSCIAARAAMAELRVSGLRNMGGLHAPHHPAVTIAEVGAIRDKVAVLCSRLRDLDMQA